jgi:hypothetical protein
MEILVKNRLTARPGETEVVPGALRIGELMPAVLARYGIDPLAVRERRNGWTLVVVHSANTTGIAQSLATA